MADISNIRTLEDLTNVVSQLYFNLNKIEALYYNMFVNPAPMMLDLERYDENGILGTISVPNRAMDMQKAYTGKGNPNGQQVAPVGSIYVDTNSRASYYKSIGSDSEGWIELWSSQNFRANDPYLPANGGDASNLTNINLANDPVGVLPVLNGGTGIGSNSLFSGMVKANGNQSYSKAVDGTDYISPSSIRGMVVYYAGPEVPPGWVKCDGSAYVTSGGSYTALFNVIGHTYDTETTPEGKFAVPNLMSQAPEHMIPIIKA